MPSTGNVSSAFHLAELWSSLSSGQHTCPVLPVGPPPPGHGRPTLPPAAVLPGPAGGGADPDRGAQRHSQLIRGWGGFSRISGSSDAPPRPRRVLAELPAQESGGVLSPWGRRCWSPRNQSLGTRSGCPRSSVGKESACNAGDPGLTPGWGRSSGEGNGNPLHCSCLENPEGRGAWWATVCGVARAGHDLGTTPPPQD